MPPKSKSRSPDPAPTRAGLLARYRLSDRTLRALTDERGPLRLTPVAEDGLVRYPLDDAADFVLRTASACPFSFAGPRPPWLRFALMRLTASAAEEVAEDLLARGIVRTAAEVTRVGEVERALLAGLPEPLADAVRRKRRPTNADEKAAWDLLLRITNTTLGYRQPELLEPFYFQDESVLHLINQVLLTTAATPAARAALLNYAAGYEMLSPAGVLWYGAFFADWSFMRATDEAAHLATFRPSVRAAYLKARACTLDEFMTLCSITQDTVREMQHVSRTLKKRLHGLLASEQGDAIASAMKVLQTIVKIDDHIGKLQPGAAGKDLPAELAEIVPDEYDLDVALPTPPEFADPERQADHG